MSQEFTTTPAFDSGFSLITIDKCLISLPHNLASSPVTTKEHFERLKRTVECLHRCVAVRVSSKRVKEILPNGAAWEGDVEVFDLHDHPKADRVYAWSHDTGDLENPQQHITVLQIPPATTPLRAVQVAIAGMFREQEANAES